MKSERRSYQKNYYIEKRPSIHIYGPKWKKKKKKKIKLRTGVHNCPIWMVKGINIHQYGKNRMHHITYAHT